jgi:COMPASS component SWD1
MKGMDFAKSGRRLVTNSSDRTLRQFILPKYPDPPTEAELQNQTTTFDFLDIELEPTHRFNDPINRTAWHAMCYSPDGEWLAGGKEFRFYRTSVTHERAHRLCGSSRS